MRFTLTLALAAIAATTAKADRPLKFLGWNPRGLLKLCQGDCDSNKNCAKGLKCQHRNRLEHNMTGCSGVGIINADYCIVDRTQLQPSASQSLSKCGGSKAFFIKSLDSKREWEAYQKAQECRFKESEERKKVRNTAVMAWFKSVAAAKSSKAAYIKAFIAFNSIKNTMAQAQRKVRRASKTANTQARWAQKALLAWRSAIKAAQTGNAAQAKSVFSAKLRQTKVRNYHSAAVTKARNARDAAASSAKKSAHAAKNAKHAYANAVASFYKERRHYRSARATNRANQAEAKRSKAASIKAHEDYAKGSQKDASQGYFH